MASPILGHEHLRGRLAIPYLTDHGPVNMNFRCLKDHRCKDFNHQKYMTWEGLGANLYGVRYMEAAPDWITVAEGELDALSSNLAGIPCVGVSGATKWVDHWNLIFKDFTRTYVWQEGDPAGKKFADRVVTEIGAFRLELPQGEDVNSIWAAKGADPLRAMIKR